MTALMFVEVEEIGSFSGSGQPTTTTPSDFYVMEHNMYHQLYNSCYHPAGNTKKETYPQTTSLESFSHHLSNFIAFFLHFNEWAET